MNVKEMDNITVYNYGYSRVILSVRDNQYVMEPAIDGVPSTLVLSYKEIEYINGSCNVIRIGSIRFAKEMEELMYEALRVLKWKDILFEEEIESIILNPSTENTQRIIEITNIGVIERVRSVLTRLKNSPLTEHNVSPKLIKVIQQRYLEISHNRITSSIPAESVNVAPAVTPKDMEDLKKANESMKSELEEMKALMAQMMTSQQGTDISKSHNLDAGTDYTAEVTAAPKKVARNTKK